MSFVSFLRYRPKDCLVHHRIILISIPYTICADLTRTMELVEEGRQDILTFTVPSDFEQGA